MEPSRRELAAGAPVEVDLHGLEPGMLTTIAWRGMPVWILRRTPAMLSTLPHHDDLLRDPASVEPQQPRNCQNASRSIKPEYLVLVGICTHLGCSPSFRGNPATEDLGPTWPGGWFCPCHGSKFDLAGRVFKDVPAPLNLRVPPNQYLSETRLRIGMDSA